MAEPKKPNTTPPEDTEVEIPDVPDVVDLPTQDDAGHGQSVWVGGS